MGYWGDWNMAVALGLGKSSSDNCYFMLEGLSAMTMTANSWISLAMTSWMGRIKGYCRDCGQCHVIIID